MPKIFSCKVCETPFRTAQGRYNHQLYCGKPDKQCKKCLKTYSARGYDRHIKLGCGAQGKLKSPVICIKCGRVLISKYGALNHKCDRKKHMHVKSSGGYKNHGVNDLLKAVFSQTQTRIS